MTDIENNKALLNEYPFLYPRDYRGKIPESYDYTWTELDLMPLGWKEVFGIMFLDEIKKQLIKEGNLMNFRIDEIKSKFGSLRLYYHGASDKIDYIVYKYSVLSYRICEYCGRPDVRSTLGWITPTCYECWLKNRHLTNCKESYKLYLKNTYDDKTKMPTKMKWTTYQNGVSINHEEDIGRTANAIRKHWREREAHLI